MMDEPPAMASHEAMACGESGRLLSLRLERWELSVLEKGAARRGMTPAQLLHQYIWHLFTEGD